MWDKIKQWWKDSNRLQHFLLGMAVGAGANDWYCAAYTGAGVAGALEFKDYQWGGKPDWVDFVLTLAGVMIGYTVRHFGLKLLGINE